MIYKTNIFSIPIYRTRASNQKNIKKYFIEEIIPKLKNTTPNNESLNLYSDYFKNCQINSDKDLLINYYLKDIEKFKNKAGFKDNFNWHCDIDLWYNAGIKGSQQEEHDHLGGVPSTVYSAIHYVVFDSQEHESTVFFNPIYQLFLRNMVTTNDSDATPIDWQTRLLLPEVNEGDLIFFPSYLRHCVPYQNSSKIRITVAINLTFYTDEINVIRKN